MAGILTFIALAIFGLISQLALPVSAMAEFSICAWKDTMPLLYHEYDTNACPPRFNIQPNGQCEKYTNPRNHGTCVSFCEIRTTFYYGQEAPYSSMPLCSGETTCTLTLVTHQGYALKAKINDNYKVEGLTLGVTGGYSEKASRSEGHKYNKHLDHDQCGYFTFIPFQKTTCGTFTQGKYPSPVSPPSDCVIDKNEGNFCADQVITSDDGSWDNWWEPPVFYRHIRGIAVFVLVDCITLDPLPDNQQEAPYNQPGVRLPRDYPMTHALKTMWRAQQAAPVVAWSNAGQRNQAQPLNATDCQDVLATVYNLGGDLVPLGSAFKGENITLESYRTCSIYVHFDEDWEGQNCGVFQLEVAAALQSTFDLCYDNSTNTVSGSHTLRNKGNCGSTVSFEYFQYSD